MGVIIQKSAFDVGDQINAFSQNHTKMGAIVTFTGIVRDNDNETLKAMEIEHYPGMAEKAISEISSIFFLKISKLFITKNKIENSFNSCSSNLFLSLYKSFVF